jgi:hypothetical protein
MPCKPSLLIQAFHSGFDVSCYSTVKISLIRGAYSPFTHRPLASPPSFERSPRMNTLGEGQPLRISRPDDLTKIVVSCSVAIGTFGAFDLHRVEGVLTRPLATPLPLGESEYHPATKPGGS